MAELAFLKLGGSLITDKTRPLTARADIIARCAREIASAWERGLQLVVGHGSGSYGHAVARQYGTRQGVRGPEHWYGYARVADAARRLNCLVVQALLEEELPAVSVPPSATAWARAGELLRMDVETISALLSRGALPVVHGDVALDEEWGGTIVSTEQVLIYLAAPLRPARMVLAGAVAGVYSADPNLDPGATLYSQVTSANYEEVLRHLGGARGADVTGGMADKVRRMYDLAARQPGLTIQLVSGLQPGLLERTLLGRALDEGTRIER
ncbi:MAG: isopentenyl phosphate kinase family protein [Anaerolineae bacterium]|nr:isopentenyl phosphate kinase family protein [Anaerolineae bacterium]